MTGRAVLLPQLGNGLSWRHGQRRAKENRGGEDSNIHIVAQQLSYVYIYFIYTEEEKPTELSSDLGLQYVFNKWI